MKDTPKLFQKNSWSNYINVLNQEKNNMKYYKIIISTIIIYILACFSTYFSMQEYSNEISSSCFNCSYSRDIILSSAYISLIFIILIFLKKTLKKNWNISIYFSVIYFILVFFNNYNIFLDRVSAWSTYTLLDEFLSVLTSSFLYLNISAVLVFITLKLYKF